MRVFLHSERFNLTTPFSMHPKNSMKKIYVRVSLKLGKIINFFSFKGVHCVVHRIIEVMCGALVAMGATSLEVEQA